MSHNLSTMPSHLAWKDLYVAALFESDRPKIASRIATAQAAITARKRELTISVRDVQERHTLDNALFSLEALKSCLAIIPAVHLQHSEARPGLS